ncbi:unnamed protein product [Orchesella dallaii]|uniref:Gustatory receptor n=1 Tax=Orchesella dallaii TaxID=48710 RepID=A0ABP1RIH1_9HEXA
MNAHFSNRLRTKDYCFTNNKILTPFTKFSLKFYNRLEKHWFPGPVGIDAALLDDEKLRFHHRAGGRYLIPWKISLIFCTGFGVVIPSFYNLLYLDSGHPSKSFSTLEKSFQILYIMIGIALLAGSYLTLNCPESIDAVNKIIALNHPQQKQRFAEAAMLLPREIDTTGMASTIFCLTCWLPTYVISFVAIVIKTDALSYILPQPQYNQQILSIFAYLLNFAVRFVVLISFSNDSCRQFLLLAVIHSMYLKTSVKLLRILHLSLNTRSERFVHRAYTYIQIISKIAGNFPKNFRVLFIAFTQCWLTILGWNIINYWGAIYAFFSISFLVMLVNGLFTYTAIISYWATAWKLSLRIVVNRKRRYYSKNKVMHSSWNATPGLKICCGDFFTFENDAPALYILYLTSNIVDMVMLFP